MTQLATASPALEERTQQIGRALFARIRAGGGDREPWWDRWLMQQTMRDEAVKAQLFRFVDVLPGLATPSQVNGHLHEYLGEVRDRLPAPLGRTLGLVPRDGWLGERLANLTRRNARKMALRFISASDLPGAIQVIRKLRDRKLAFTIDLLGEAVLSGAEAERYQQQYLHLITGLSAAAEDWPEIGQIDRQPGGEPLPRVNVSVKLSSLYSQFDPIDPAGTSRAVRERLRPILRLARRRGAFVNIDMEQFSFKDATLRIVQDVFEEDEFRDWRDVGLAIQAYLKSCGQDLEMLAQWVERRGAPLWVRLVKGAYWDYETVIAAQNGWPVPVWERKAETDANYERQTDFLMSHSDLLRPAIASHNVRSIAHALATAEARGLSAGDFEFQMLYGMAEPIKTALVSMGHWLRVYTPFGELLPGMAYLVRRLLENTSNESFLRAGFLENLPEEQLLMNPLERLRTKSSAQRPRLVPSGRDGHDSGNGHATTAPFRNEPLSDFSQEGPRRAMQRALDDLRPYLGSTFPAIINGEKIESGQWIESRSPSHVQQVIGRCTRATPAQARDAIAAAKSAFPAWRDAPPEDRAALLLKSAEVLRVRRFELSAWEVYETGKQWREADADVAEAIDYCAYYAREMLRLSAPHERNVPGEQNATFYESRGVAVVIAPWNFPLAILCGMTAAALVTGNTVVMKPAEQSSVIAAKLMEVFQEAGFPPGVVSFLPGIGEEIGPLLVGSPDVSTIAFTGSRAVGIAIEKQAAEVSDGQDHLKRVITELGGKNAVIVDDDADLDEAVHGVVASAFGYAGQKCSACSRAIVLARVYDTFLARLIEATRSLKIGPAEDPGNFVGPVIDDEARQRILKRIEQGKTEARLAYSAELGALAEEGNYVPPTIFAEVPPSASIAQDEIFGPVLCVMKAGDLTEALSIANGTRYALTGGIFSRSPGNIARVRREFRVGNLYINRKITGALVDRQPFGGFKLSGVGTKAGGPDYLLHFVNARTITENTLRHGFAPQPPDGAADGPAGE